MSAVTFEQVLWTDKRAVALQRILEEDLHGRYAHHLQPGPGRDAALRALAVDPDDVLATVLAISGDTGPVAHAALRSLNGEWEVKRVVVLKSERGRGVASMLMGEIEATAARGGALRVILQTGDNQPEAVALYAKLGYKRIPVYEPYASAIPFSFCFEKRLR
ncbi:GNAT family N-acetyltransferase [Arthrobacter sp. CDRTa11]|uniref:GNAT family N-acetyltransferase n=1 Tax=Arthrobacter sp. CDRTa11 TaxID=2651199 RepID=UPI002265C46E|nr:GNAT family N-acetyltransferase [Arthrobacter sp. CDRTa11]UZX03210.1 GNAT family N-acetyltransferase [Arthrobacter sp. CDRTa11]